MSVTVQANNTPLNLLVDSDTATVEMQVSVEQTKVELASVGDVNYITNNYGGQVPITFEQTVANTLWGGIGGFNHNFNRELTSCRVIDTGGNEWEGIIVEIDLNFCKIDIGPYAYAGKVTLF